MNHLHDGREGESGKIEAFEEKLEHELEDFEARQRRELEAFQAREREELEEFARRKGQAFTVKIDRTEFQVSERKRTGAQLRELPQPPVGVDRDLFEVVPGGSDRKIDAHEEVKMRDGLRFFTAPARINPGSGME